MAYLQSRSSLRHELQQLLEHALAVGRHVERNPVLAVNYLLAQLLNKHKHKRKPTGDSSALLKSIHIHVHIVHSLYAMHCTLYATHQSLSLALKHARDTTLSRYYSDS